MRKTRRKFREKKREFYRVNEQIYCPEVCLIDENGENLGTMPTHLAIQKAREREMDLVEVYPTANPPIAKLLDYGKFKYQKERELQKQKAKQKKVDIKGIRLSLRIGQHDRDLRLSQAKKFLENGNKLKIELILKGRERQYFYLAKDIINKFIESVNQEQKIKIEQQLTNQGGRLTVIAAPIR